MTNHRVDRAVPISTSSARSQSLNQCTINGHKTGAHPSPTALWQPGCAMTQSRQEKVGQSQLHQRQFVCLQLLILRPSLHSVSVAHGYGAPLLVVCCYRLSHAGGYIPIISFLLVLFTFFALSFLAIIDRHHSLSFCNENRVEAQTGTNGLFSSSSWTAYGLKLH